MATNIPPHNLNELIDGPLALIDNPEITDQELIRLIPGPDFPRVVRSWAVKASARPTWAAAAR